MDLGDKESQLCVLGADNEIRQEVRVRMTTPALQAWFAAVEQPAMVVMEAGSHSPWVSRLLEQSDAVTVTDPRRLSRGKMDGESACGSEDGERPLSRFPLRGKAGAGGFPPRRDTSGASQNAVTIRAPVPPARVISNRSAESPCESPC